MEKEKTLVQTLLEDELKKCDDVAMELARRLKINNTSVWLYIAGRAKPSFRNLEKIAAYFKVPVEDLMGGDRDKYYRTMYRGTGESNQTPQDKALLAMWGQLDEEKRKQVLKFILDLM